MRNDKPADNQGNLLKRLDIDYGVFTLCLLGKSSSGLLLVFQQTEPSPRKLNGDFVEYICGQVSFYLERVLSFQLSCFQMTGMDFETEQEENDYRQHGLLARDILDFTVSKTQDLLKGYLLVTTLGEEISFLSNSEPVIERTVFDKPLRQDVYLNQLKSKYSFPLSDSQN